MKRSDFRPSDKSRRLSVHDKGLMHKHNPYHRAIHHAESRRYIALEKKYHDLHVAYHNAKTEKHKRLLAKHIKAHHYKIVASRNRMHRNPENHTLLQKLHGHKDIVNDKSVHRLVDTTNETEHVKLVKAVVPPTKTHALRDLGRGIKAVGVGVGEVAGAGLSKLGNKLTDFANGLMSSNKSQHTDFKALGISDVTPTKD